MAVLCPKASQACPHFPRTNNSDIHITILSEMLGGAVQLCNVNAGHPPPILVHGSAVKCLESTGLILGAVCDVEFYRASASFEPGAVLVMYSDGVLERHNGNEEFGLARLEEVVIRHQQESASAILNAIYQTILAFGDQSRWLDDVTIVVIKKWLDDFPTKGLADSRSGSQP